MKAYKCVNCGFITYEKNKVCPICEDSVERVDIEKKDDKPFANPIRIEKKDSDVNFSYYCYKCKKYSGNKICMDCNVNSYLSIELKGKRYVLGRLRSLSEVYSPKEVNQIARETDQEEKELIYRNLEDSSRFFYRKDKTKATSCFVAAIMLYLVGFIISTNKYEDLLLSSIANALGNGMFVMFLSLGFGYLNYAYFVEEEYVTIGFGVITIILMLIYLAIANLLELSYATSFIVGLVFTVIAIVTNIIYYSIVRKLK